MSRPGRRKVGDTVGGYRLLERVGEGPMTSLWQAEQVSMHRSVMLEMLKQNGTNGAGGIEVFLADVRAKALVSHPGIGRVYEAVSNETGTYFARERLEGETLEELRAQGRQFMPAEVVLLLEQISAAMLHLEAMGMAIVEMELQHIIVDQDLGVRMMNLAVDGEPEIFLGTKAKQLLGTVFDGLLVRGQPGSVRVNSLLEFMADLERAHPLTWRQILDLSKEVRSQLTGSSVPSPKPGASGAQPSMTPPAAPWKKPMAALALTLGAVAIAVMIYFIGQGDRERDAIDTGQEEEQAPIWIEIASGEVVIQGGRSIVLDEGFSMSQTEVTLSQYARFLEELANLGGDEAEIYNHPEQPAGKMDHRPSDWDEMWAAARDGRDWKGRRIYPKCPVTGVDWWDAWAFCQWEGTRLPTMDEWSAAGHFKGAPDKVSGWGPADASPDDITGAGLVGMAGNVREWTRDVELNPAFQLSPRKPVAAGGSFQDPAQGVASREWLDDRKVRRPDLGFRTLR